MIFHISFILPPLASIVPRVIFSNTGRVKEGSANWVDRICQFTYFWQILYDEDEVVTLRVFELQLRFFLWNIWGHQVPPTCNISMYTHQAHHLSNWYFLKHENYKKIAKFTAWKWKRNSHIKCIRFKYPLIFEWY